MKWIRTISGRIVLGFVVLWTTFAVVTGYGIWQMQQLGGRLRFIRSAYLQIAPDILQLQGYTTSARDYFEEDSRASRRFATQNREFRRRLIAKIQQRLDTLDEIPPGVVQSISQTREQIAEVARELDDTDALVDQAFVTDAQTSQRARRQLQVVEARLVKSVKSLNERLQNHALQLVSQVERAERLARYWALAMGALATVVALLVTAWAIVTLRPLRRLRDGARQVARGDYRGRVEAQGGTEVAELAREFNAMAAAIEEREQQLVRSERLVAVGKMAAVITHEIRNPLSSIGLNTELLEEELGRIAGGEPADEARQLVASVQKEVDRLTAITEEYLRFARLPRPKVAREQVNDIASELIEFERGGLLARGVSVECRLADGLPEVLADEAQLRQALLNLLRNAGEAVAPERRGDGKHGGTVRVVTRAAGDGVEIRVEDDGPGIPPEHLPRLFEAFFTTKDGGTGLGLALTQQIIAEHGGRIDVASGEGGTTFTIRLPAAA